MRTETADGRLNGKLLAEWFWTDRWMGSSGFLLPLEARGLYREMLTQAWRRGASLPNDHESIRRATGTTKSEWKRCWPKVESFWRVEGDTLVNDTQVAVYNETRARYQRESERGRKAGLVSGQVRHTLNTRSTCVPTQVQHVSNPPSPSPSPSPSPEKSTRGAAFVGSRIRVPTFLHDDLHRLKGGLTFDLLAWYPRLDAELVASGEPICDEIAFVRERFYAAAKIKRPSLHARDDEPVGRQVPSHEETRAWLQKQRELDAQIERERAAAPGLPQTRFSLGARVGRESEAGQQNGAGDE